MQPVTIKVPNVLGEDVKTIEAFYNHIQEVIPAKAYEIDMSQVSYIRPYGLLALLIAGRRLKQTSGSKVLLSRMLPKIHQYLERMALFEIENNCFDVDKPIEERWNRDSNTANLLEVSLISNFDDINSVICRAENIYSKWLSVSHINNLISVLSELCTNIFEHSGDKYGCVLIQKVKIQEQVIVRLAVGDLGCGIPGSFINSFGSNNIKNTITYLTDALGGKTSRSTGRGGLGLRQVERIVDTTGGYLWLRSHNAAIKSFGPGEIQGFPALAFIPGTQVAVELYST
ncbi:ATP-binding protein [Anabaena azotica]|uniref:Sensor histidine kinase n=1 Tax=Anabaena azotica FACHB-119 TaxID=947527 RepID=A0ABR8DES6_9NOST|nr:ATP-binding protein [Anabaena azotica]MBD2505144.1 sensor histidine kinase [Anabaena azotica FACHB-119]